MDKRFEVNWLMDFYGPLLTENRRRVLLMHIEEDLSYQEIAEQMGISRQGVHDAMKRAEEQLRGFEEKLGLLDRYVRILKEIDELRVNVNRLEADSADERALTAIGEAVRRMEMIEGENRR